MKHCQKNTFEQLINFREYFGIKIQKSMKRI